MRRKSKWEVNLIGCGLHFSLIYLLWLSPGDKLGFPWGLLDFIFAIWYVTAVIACIVHALQNKILKESKTDGIWAILIFLLGGVGSAHFYFWRYIWS